MATGRLQGKIALITGGARGIGAESARLFAREGAQVMIADVRDELGAQVVEHIKAEGGSAAYAQCDVTSQNAVRAAVQATVDAFGPVTVLFNNAGTVIVGDVVELSEEDWDKTYAINVKSMFLTGKYVVPLMRQAGGGSIINQSSESGLIGFPMHPAYCSSKGAVINLTRSMAMAYAADNIRVNCICPGTITTPLYREFIEALPNQQEVEEMLKREHPLGLGSEADIAYAALYLASDESKYMTGAPLVIDGGFTAR